MDVIHFERQEASLCAQHALNMVLQGPYFSASDLAEIALEMDRREGNVLEEASGQSQNMDDSGFFSVQVIAEALKVFNLELMPMASVEATPYRFNPTYQFSSFTINPAYICNQLGHWFAVRRIGFQWFALNSLALSPRLLTDTHLNVYFAQLINDGYLIFAVLGTLPPCSADEILMHCPIDPALAAQSDAFASDFLFDQEIERVKALSLETAAQEAHDPDLLMALKLSKSVNVNDDELEHQLQLALHMSIENQIKPSTSSAENPKPDPVVDSDLGNCSLIDSSSTAHCPLPTTNVTAQSDLATDDTDITDEVRSKHEIF